MLWSGLWAQRRESYLLLFTICMASSRLSACNWEYNQQNKIWSYKVQKIVFSVPSSREELGQKFPPVSSLSRMQDSVKYKRTQKLTLFWRSPWLTKQMQSSTWTLMVRISIWVLLFHKLLKSSKDWCSTCIIFSSECWSLTKRMSYYS